MVSCEWARIHWITLSQFLVVLSDFEMQDIDNHDWVDDLGSLRPTKPIMTYEPQGNWQFG